MSFKQIMGLGIAFFFLTPTQTNALCSSLDKKENRQENRELIAVSAVNHAWSGNYLSVDYAECKSRAESAVGLLLGNTNVYESETSVTVTGSSSSVSGSVVCFGVEGTVAYTIDTGGCNHYCGSQCDSELIYGKLANFMENGI